MKRIKAVADRKGYGAHILVRGGRKHPHSAGAMKAKAFLKKLVVGRKAGIATDNR